MTNVILPNNELTMSHIEIAELVGSRADSVKRTVDRLAEKGVIQLPPMVDVKNSKNQSVKEYRINKRDSYVVVAQLSPEFTARLVDRWQELESQQHNPTMILVGLLEQNVKMIQDLHSQKIALEQKIEQDKPMTSFGKMVSESATSVKIGDWIKALADDGFKLGRNKAFCWLRENGYLMKDSQPYQQYVNQGLFEVKEGLIVTSKGQRATFTTLLTGKGQVYFANKLKAAFEQEVA